MNERKEEQYRTLLNVIAEASRYGLDGLEMHEVYDKARDKFKKIHKDCIVDKNYIIMLNDYGLACMQDHVFENMKPSLNYSVKRAKSFEDLKE